MKQHLDSVRKSPSRIFRTNSDAAKRMGVSEEEVEDFKTYLLGNEAKEPLTTFVDSIQTTKDGNKYMVTSDRPLNKSELESFLQVDGIGTYLKQYWIVPNKKKEGLFSYSVLIGCRDNFLTPEEIESRIVSVIDKHKIEIPKRKVDKEFINLYISDIHAGAVINDSIYNNQYNEDVLIDRVKQIVEEVAYLKSSQRVINVVNLGDQLDGYNGLTTRGGHSLGSRHNSEQFDIYINAMSLLLCSLKGLFEGVNMINVDNSNHSGNGFSYIANTALKYKVAKEGIRVENRGERIFHEIIGCHAFIYTHGKDEKHMTRGWGLKLTPDLDKKISEYLRFHKLLDYNCHLVKGDLHQYGHEYGSCFRYLNIPSIMGANDYAESNFANTKAGCVVEVFNSERNIFSHNVLHLK